MPLNQTELQLVDLLIIGKSYREIAQEVGLSKSAVERWSKRPEIVAAVDEGLQSISKTISKSHEEVISGYKEALLKASSHSPKLIENLVAIAQDPENRVIDRIKAAEVVLTKAERFMTLVEERKTFPEDWVRKQEEIKALELQQRKFLIANGWIETIDGYWINPSDRLKFRYSLGNAYSEISKAL